ncbi:unnamed protein product [Chrysodeixis includens]|uniref:Uncharacterized protein n=1 Tax=Chrysodeixis includens TaxID=689277 RepID=A0A9P0BWV5_CHRIL|nr:unnamed protein product [Chrysodeixis includens]
MRTWRSWPRWCGTTAPARPAWTWRWSRQSTAARCSRPTPSSSATSSAPWRRRACWRTARWTWTPCWRCCRPRSASATRPRCERAARSAAPTTATPPTSRRSAGRTPTRMTTSSSRACALTPPPCPTMAPTTCSSFCEILHSRCNKIFIFTMLRKIQFCLYLFVTHIVQNKY